MRRASVLFLLSLLSASLLAGCLDAGQSGSIEASPEAASGASTRAVSDRTVVAGGVPESTVGVAPEGEVAKVSEASSGARFEARTDMSGGSGYDADTVLAVRYGVHDGYERVVLDLGTGEKPAEAIPRWTLASPKGDGLLRVNLPSTSATCVSDGRFGEDLLASYHVVRAPEGGMFVDFFARKAFRYRVLEIADPARLVVDFKPTGAELKVPLPVEGGKTVLVEPRSNARISDPLSVSGYSRNFEAANTITLTGSDGKVLVRRTVLGNDWGSTWGYFEATFDLPRFAGKGILKVGARSARDGSFEGVNIPVRAR